MTGPLLLLQQSGAMLEGSPLLATEFAAALLQGVVTIGLTALTWHFHQRYRRPWFAWFALAWGIYVLRLVCIAAFLGTEQWGWLYWHQVTTGWTALILLWAALSFSRELRLRRRYLLALLFPPLWSYVAIYVMDQFIWAALPAVAFLSLATLWTGAVFWQYQRIVRSPGARLLAIAFTLWGLHHLDYPFLRAQGAWSPWGYYLDLSFELLVGAGLMLLVLDDLGRGVRAMTLLSADLHRRERGGDLLDALLTRPLTLPGVRGAAMFVFDEATRAARDDGAAAGVGEGATGAMRAGEDAATGRFTRGAGSCAAWADAPADERLTPMLAALHATGSPQAAAPREGEPYVSALPVVRGGRVAAALVMAGDVRNPFTALDDDFLRALGQQVGASLEQAALDRQLAARTVALERLSTRMVQQHEEERRRLSRELHDETAQVFSAVKMQLESLRPVLSEPTRPRLDRLLALVDTGIGSIRRVTSDLRPSLLDDLGLLPAMRSLLADFTERSGLRVRTEVPAALPALAPEAELALFRALQEALANVARHAQAASVQVTLRHLAHEGVLALDVIDDGRGLPLGDDGQPSAEAFRTGLTGMRERLLAVGGALRVASPGTGGAHVHVRLPVAAGAPVAVPADGPSASPADASSVTSRVATPSAGAQTAATAPAASTAHAPSRSA